MYMLRELERKDIAEINTWRLDRDLISCLVASYRFIGEEIDLQWFDPYLDSRSNTIRCVVVDDENPSQVLGAVSLINIDWVARSATYGGVMIKPEKQGKGIGTFATNAILGHAFEDMNLHRIEGVLLSDNKRSLRMCEKCGFVIEGTKREAVFKQGRYEDLTCVGILEEEWREKRQVLGVI